MSQTGHWLERIREILLREYIGAITIGFLFAQAIGKAAGGIVEPIAFHLARLHQSTSVFEAPPKFSFQPMFLAFLSAALHVLAASLLLRWLYLRPSDSLEVEAASLAEDATGEEDSTGENDHD